MARLACLLWRPPRRGLCSSLPLVLTVCFCGFVLLIWYGMNSDRDYIHPLLNQLIPAGHCACQSATIFQCSSCVGCAQSGSVLQQQQPGPSSSNWRFRYDVDSGNEGLDREQCKTAFAGLFEDVDRAVKYWQLRGHPLTSADLDQIYLEYGMARAWISGGELYVMATRARNEDHRRKILAVLSAIHRALVADGDRRSRDIEFVFSVEDKVEDVTGPERPVWVFSRTALEEAVWLMPDFGFWAWNNPQNPIGPYDQVVEQIQRSEVPWAEKLPQLVWRGKPSFAPKLRRALLEAARGKPWGDVKQVDWYGRANILRMEDHCKYMFIAHVEGRSYSASLKYRQACSSVIVAHRLQFIQHHHYLLVSSGPNQNFVEVERDFSDLAEKLEPLVHDPVAANRIADNSVRTFRERYLTKAAESCYWRALFDGYARVWDTSSQNHHDPRQRALRYESFVLLESSQMMKFTAAGS